ncbi:MAG: glycosyltransferase [Planctomycetaceae bacterium]
MTTPHITVAVCTRNRAGALRAAVESLSHLETRGRFTSEILIVDNGSTDDTPAVAAELARRLPIEMRYSREEMPGVVHARNRAIADARGEWLAFFDDDQAADPHWLLALLDLAERRDAQCVGGKVVLRLPPGVERDLSPICRMLLGESVGLDEERKYSATVTPGAGNLMVRRAALQHVGGFDPVYNGRGEDTDLFLRLMLAGIDGWYTPAAIIHHIIPPERISDDYLLRMSERMAQGMAENERRVRGALLYPIVYAARVAQTAAILWPRYLLARLRGDTESALGARCRLRIARGYLREGRELLMPVRAWLRRAPASTRSVG